jgi:uncharacterized protein
VSRYLLDANVLVALVVAEHAHHPAASELAREAELLLVCPVAEGALVRYLVRVGERAVVAQEVLRRLYQDPRVDTCPDDVSHVSADLADVVGHRQVTDAYLVALAAARGVTVATFDRAMATTWPSATTLLT